MKGQRAWTGFPARSITIAAAAGLFIALCVLPVLYMLAISFIGMDGGLGLVNYRGLLTDGRRIELLQSDLADWRITFVDAGINSTIGQRLQAVEPHLRGEAEFLANYADGLSDLPLPAQLEHFRQHDCTAGFVCVRPQVSYHFIVRQHDGRVSSVQDIDQTGLRINGGFFIFRKEIFNYLRNGDDLVMGAFQRLLAQNRLLAYHHDGFWQSMDTFKDKQLLDEMYARGDAPWEVWKGAARSAVPIRRSSRRRRAAAP